MLARLYSLAFALAVLQPAIAGHSCSGDVHISSQSDADAISNCQSIKGTLTVNHDASGSINLDQLQKIQGGFTIDGTSDLTKVSASNLQSIKYDLSVKYNGALSRLSMPNLEQVDGNVKIKDNDQLNQLQFKNLEEVKGGLELAGGFDSVSFPNLDQVDGQASIRSSGDLSCSDFSRLKSNGVFDGPYSCSTGSSASSTSSSSGASSDSGLSGGAKAGIAIAVIVVVAIILGAIWFLYKRRKSNVAFQSVPTAARLDPEKGAMQQTDGEAHSGPPPVTTSGIPRKPITPAPPEPEIPMLDSGNVHEAPTMPLGETRDPSQVFELDAGPVWSAHQQPIHHE